MGRYYSVDLSKIKLLNDEVNHVVEILDADRLNTQEFCNMNMERIDKIGKILAKED
jgi:hypothetical protein